MLNIGVGSIITKGLGGPALNLMIFGPFRLYIEPIVITPTPTATSGLTPTPTPTHPGTSPSVPVPSPPRSGGGGGGGIAPPRDDWDDEDDVQKYKLTFVVNFRKHRVTRSFMVDSFTKDKIIKRVGKINTLRLKFKVAWDKVTNNRFITRWKK